MILVTTQKSKSGSLKSMTYMGSSIRNSIKDLRSVTLVGRHHHNKSILLNNKNHTIIVSYKTAKTLQEVVDLIESGFKDLESISSVEVVK